MAMRISKSKISTYESCPHNYENCYVKKLPMPITPFAMSRGVDIHNILEQFTKEDFVSIDEAFAQLSGKYPDNKEPIRNFSEFMKRITPVKGKVLKPIMTEEKLYDPKLDIVGVVDAVYPSGDKKIVLDYKSGNVNEMKKYRFELAIYAYLVENIKGIKLDYWGIYFVDHDKLISEKIDRDFINTALLKVQTIVTKIKMGEFPKAPKYPCKGCMSYMNGHCKGV